MGGINVFAEARPPPLIYANSNIDSKRMSNFTFAPDVEQMFERGGIQLRGWRSTVIAKVRNVVLYRCPTQHRCPALDVSIQT